MFPVFIGINEKFINLNAIAMIEDFSEEGRTIARITTIEGGEIDLVEDDAELLFDRAELICTGSDAIFGKLQAEADAADTSDTDTSEGNDSLL